MLEYDDSSAETFLDQQVNSSIRLAGIVSICFTAPVVVALAWYALSRREAELFLSLGLAAIGLVHAAVATRLGLQRRATGRVAFLLLLPLAGVPVLVAWGAAALGRAGAATVISGPVPFILLVLIVLSGFAFDARLSVVVGLCSAGGYLLLYAFARQQLGTLRAGDPVVAEMLASSFAHVVKAFLLGVTGVLVGALSETTHRLIRRVSRELQEKAFIRETFGMLVDPRVRDRMIDGQLELGGETRVSSVLFADIRGFSTFSERMSPKELLLFMKEYFDLMNAEIRRCDGTILEYVGDEVMAVFGAPIPMEDHASRALLAAVGMQRALEAKRPEWEGQGKPAVRAGIGIHTGPMLVGIIGSSDRCKYGAVGDNVNVASRLQGLTKEYGSSIIVSEETVRAAGDGGVVAVKELDRVRVRGRETPVTIYAVTEGARVSPS